jgi:hypothetical protein
MMSFNNLSLGRKGIHYDISWCPSLLVKNELKTCALNTYYKAWRCANLRMMVEGLVACSNPGIPVPVGNLDMADAFWTRRFIQHNEKYSSYQLVSVFSWTIWTLIMFRFGGQLGNASAPSCARTSYNSNSHSTVIIAVLLVTVPSELVTSQV